jgi:hypothetical protein
MQSTDTWLCGEDELLPPQEPLEPLVSEVSETEGAPRAAVTVPRLNPKPLNPKVVLGMHPPGSWAKIVEVEECLLQSEIAGRVYAHVK